METNEKSTTDELNFIRNKRRKKKKRRKKILFFCITAVVIITLGNIFFGYARVRTDKSVKISAGSSTFDIANTLKKEGVISKKLKFITEVVISGNYGKLKFGDFKLEKGMTYSQVIELMKNEGAKKETVTLTVPEGFSVENIIERMVSMGIGSEEEIEAALTGEYNYKFIDKIPEKDGQKYKLQGFLFPSTYEFYTDATPQKVIDTMLAEFEKQYDKLGGDYENIYEIITKASMVEREARIDSERATIAGVFENRLKKGMKMQIDATVVYAISDGKYDVQRVLYKDLKTESPYNTYYVEGLPVGPICNPGAKSIDAALNPQKHEYIFYHMDDNKQDGSHIFTKTYDEHEETMN